MDHSIEEALRPDEWPLDPVVTMLNHGSFGSCPVEVLRKQAEFQEQLEREPVQFFVRTMQPLLDESRTAFAGLVGCKAEDLVFVSNATAGVNCVLRSLRFRPGDQILVTDHGYNACRNVATYVCQRDGAELVVAALPWPCRGTDEIVDAVHAHVTERTRLAMLDHVTSPTALVLPIDRLVRELAKRGVETLVDGAHAPGMVEVNLAKIGAAYYAGNCHKWLCAPKGAGFLHARADRQEALQPNIISHGFNTTRPRRSRFHDRFDWIGTLDYSPWLCVGAAIEFIRNLTADGLAGLMRRNRELPPAGAAIAHSTTESAPVGPETIVGSMAAVHLSDDADPTNALDDSTTPGPSHRLGRALWEQYRIEVPVFHFPAAPKKLIRVSVQAYNKLADYEYLADALAALLEHY